jgi:DNA-binding sugar fermentation-stimulating protein
MNIPITDATLELAGQAAYERFWLTSKDANKTAPWANIDPVFKQFWREIAQASINAYFDAASLRPHG